jgi:prepilin-type N-terminal cleavage/methylation domain-containing protein/prepilin-type processing-associated H-X9-DG protein
MCRRAFTLLELVVVLAIIAAALGLLLPAVVKVRAVTNRSRCQNNLKLIGLACHNYHDSFGAFPPGFTAWSSLDSTSTSPGWGWASQLLPFLEQDSVHRQIRFDLPIEDPRNAAARNAVISVYICPADIDVPPSFGIDNGSGHAIAEAAPLSYAGCWGGGELDEIPGPKEGILYRNSHIRLTDITDGTSSTTMIGDRAWSHAMAPWAGAIQHGLLRPGPLNPWRNTSSAIAPATQLVLAHNRTINDDYDRDGSLDDYFGNHPDGVNMLFADGSVHFLRSKMERAILRAMGTRAGGEVVDPGDF